MSWLSETEDAVEQVRRGVKKYTERGKYVKQDIENGVSYRMAYNWIRRGNEVQSMKVGVTMRKVSY